MSRTDMPRAYIATVRRENDPPDRFLVRLTLVDPIDPCLALGHQPGLEAAVPVARYLELERPAVAPYRLAARAAPPVRLRRRHLGPMPVAQMLGQIRAQHPLPQRALEALHQAPAAKQILGPLAPPSSSSSTPASILSAISHAPLGISMDRQPHTQKIGYSPCVHRHTAGRLSGYKRGPPGSRRCPARQDRPARPNGADLKAALCQSDRQHADLRLHRCDLRVVL